MVSTLGDTWMWWGQIKERIIGGGGANIAVHLKVFVRRCNNIHCVGIYCWFKSTYMVLSRVAK